MTPAAFAVIGVAILGSSFLSGIFGMAGGLILLGVLLLYLDVAPAMVLFGAIQMGANGWRALLWRGHVHWNLVWRYLIGSTTAFIVMRFVGFLPDKAMIFIGLGVLPFLTDLLPKSATPDITRPGAPYICGFVIMVLQLLAGAAGHVLDLFFQKSKLDRRSVVGTKAVCQTVSHLFRILYFGSLEGLDAQIPWWVFLIALCLAFSGTSLAALVLQRMTDDHFRLWSKRVIYAVSSTFLVKGLLLLSPI
jgi:uncharacterized membrane protein YfcA